MTQWIKSDTGEIIDSLHHNLAGNTAFAAAWKPANETMLTTGWGYTI